MRWFYTGVLDGQPFALWNESRWVAVASNYLMMIYHPEHLLGIHNSTRMILNAQGIDDRLELFQRGYDTTDTSTLTNAYKPMWPSLLPPSVLSIYHKAISRNTHNSSSEDLAHETKIITSSNH
jgi:hypothetical protein